MNNQLDLFSESSPKKVKLGHADLIYKDVSSILTKASGFMDSYDYSINPYSGCSFGCTYCYAAFFSRDSEKMNNWGKWVDVKENALALLAKKRKKPMLDTTIYMSSVTDPYQPIEKELELTRGILKELLQYHKVRLVIQTRSQLVTRDIDLIKQFEHVQVNMTITTDNEEVRKVFEPYCPNNKVRLNAIQLIKEAGIDAAITMTPLLPIESPSTFADDLIATRIEKFVIQPFHNTKGKFAAGTRNEALQILEKYNWSEKEYQRILEIMLTKIPNLTQGKEGFAAI